MGECSMTSPEVIAISVDRLEAVLSTGEIVEMTDWFDEDGDETENPDEALSMVGRMGDGRWLSIEIIAFEPATLH